MQTTKLRRLFTPLLIIIALVFAVVWLISHSFVEISITNSPGGEASYTITKQEQGAKPIIVKSSSQKVKKLLKKGSYLVEVTQGDSSYLSLVKSGWIFKTSSVSANLKSEVSRQFVGDSPDPCMIMSGGILISNNCGGSYESIKTHVAADLVTPTHAAFDKKSIVGTVEGLATSKEGGFALIRQSISEDDTMMHILYSLTPNGAEAATPKEVLRLDKLKPEDSYAITRYSDGLLVYNSSFTDNYFYQTLASAPTKIDFGPQKQTGLSPKFLGASTSGVIAIYNSFISDNKKAAKKSKTEIAVFANGVARHFILNGTYDSGYLCSAGLVCLLNGQTLDIYKLGTSGKLKLVNTLRSVSAVFPVSDGSIALATTSGLADFNLNSLSGSYAYRFNDYAFKSMAVSGSSYILNLKDYKSKGFALLVDASSKSDGIDKKITELKKLPEIKDLSIYKNIIYITPELGELVYDSDSGFFGYSQAVRTEVGQKIKDDLVKQGIDTIKYTVINTLP